MATKKETKVETIATAKEEFHFKDLTQKTFTEILEIKEAVKFLIDYYGNFARANTGNYEFDSEELYQKAKNLTEKYNKAYNVLIEEIEIRVNKELFK